MDLRAHVLVSKGGVMPQFDVAHIREQGVDLIIVPLKSAFGQMSEQEQLEQIDAMQLAASSAGLAGTVVPVWTMGNRTVFIAPQSWHPFFKSVTWETLVASVNRRISW